MKQFCYRDTNKTQMVFRLCQNNDKRIDNLIWNKETAMISSPCKNCPKCSMPKLECAKDCELLKQVQEIQCGLQEQNFFSAIDYEEEGRFSLNYERSFSSIL